LAEIRRRLEALDDDGIRDALAAAPPEPSPTPSSSAALDYVRDLLSRQPPSASAQAAPPAPRHQLPAGLYSRHFGEPAQSPSAPLQQSRSTRSTWDRIPLAPDVELHVRRPLSREQNRQVERLIEAARDLFAEEL
jgi:hypothetical protein